MKKMKTCPICGRVVKSLGYSSHRDKHFRDEERSKIKNPKKRCSDCNETKPLAGFHKDKNGTYGRRNLCKECGYKRGRKNIRTRKLWNKENKDSMSKSIKAWRESNPEKLKVYKIVRKALLEGQLVRQVCEKCSNPKTHAHHPSYAKPLEVTWLCFKHHQQAHGYRITE